MRIRTVLNDLVPGALGVTDSHDHLFFRSAALPEDQGLDDEAGAVAEVRAFADAGGQAIVQWTPHGLNRRADLLPGISTSTGVAIVAATGLHRREHYPDGYVDKIHDELAEIFVRELTTGIGDTQIRAGLIKIAGGFHILDAHAEHVM